jgi:hypothetical protein
VSVVTNVILSLHEDFIVDKVNNWLFQNGHRPLLRVDELWKWGKAMECDLYIGAYNHLEVAEFVAFVKAAFSDEDTQLFIMEDGDEIFVERLASHS